MTPWPIGELVLVRIFCRTAALDAVDFAPSADERPPELDFEGGVECEALLPHPEIAQIRVAASARPFK
jgi:hypothetical protein